MRYLALVIASLALIGTAHAGARRQLPKLPTTGLRGGKPLPMKHVAAVAQLFMRDFPISSVNLASITVSTKHRDGTRRIYVQSAEPGQALNHNTLTLGRDGSLSMTQHDRMMRDIAIKHVVSDQHWKTDAAFRRDTRLSAMEGLQRLRDQGY